MIFNGWSAGVSIADPIDDLKEMLIDFDNLTARHLGELDDIGAKNIERLKPIINDTIRKAELLALQIRNGIAEDIAEARLDLFEDARNLLNEGEKIIDRIIGDFRCDINIVVATATRYKILGNSELQVLLREAEKDAFERIKAVRFFSWDTPRLSPEEIMETYYSLAVLANAVICEAKQHDPQVAQYYARKYNEYSRKAGLWAWAVNLK